MFKETIKLKLFEFMLWRTAKKLSLSCWLWNIRGLQTCPYHGFYAQSWWTGYCKECGEAPVLPPMEEMCSFCGEDKAVLQRASPNCDKEIWSICWECDRFIDWSEQSSMCAMVGNEFLDFDDWLFEKEQVYPKHDYTTCTLRKMKNEQI